MIYKGQVATFTTGMTTQLTLDVSDLQMRVAVIQNKFSTIRIESGAIITKINIRQSLLVTTTRLLARLDTFKVKCVTDLASTNAVMTTLDTLSAELLASINAQRTSLNAIKASLILQTNTIGQMMVTANTLKTSLEELTLSLSRYQTATQSTLSSLPPKFQAVNVQLNTFRQGFSTLDAQLETIRISSQNQLVVATNASRNTLNSSLVSAVVSKAGEITTLENSYLTSQTRWRVEREALNATIDQYKIDFSTTLGQRTSDADLSIQTMYDDIQKFQTDHADYMNRLYGVYNQLKQAIQVTGSADGDVENIDENMDQFFAGLRAQLNTISVAAQLTHNTIAALVTIENDKVQTDMTRIYGLRTQLTDNVTSLNNAIRNFGSNAVASVANLVTDLETSQTQLDQQIGQTYQQYPNDFAAHKTTIDGQFDVLARQINDNNTTSSSEFIRISTKEQDDIVDLFRTRTNVQLDMLVNNSIIQLDLMSLNLGSSGVQAELGALKSTLDNQMPPVRDFGALQTKNFDNIMASVGSMSTSLAQTISKTNTDLGTLQGSVQIGWNQVGTALSTLTSDTEVARVSQNASINALSSLISTAQTTLNATLSQLTSTRATALSIGSSSISTLSNGISDAMVTQTSNIATLTGSISTSITNMGTTMQTAFTNVSTVSGNKSQELSTLLTRLNNDYQTTSNLITSQASTMDQYYSINLENSIGSLIDDLSTYKTSMNAGLTTLHNQASGSVSSLTSSLSTIDTQLSSNISTWDTQFMTVQAGTSGLASITAAVAALPGSIASISTQLSTEVTSANETLSSAFVPYSNSVSSLSSTATSSLAAFSSQIDSLGVLLGV